MCICFPVKARDDSTLLQTVSTAWCSEDYNSPDTMSSSHLLHRRREDDCMCCVHSSTWLHTCQSFKNCRDAVHRQRERLGASRLAARANLSPPVLMHRRFGVTPNSLLGLHGAVGPHMCVRHVHLQTADLPCCTTSAGWCLRPQQTPGDAGLCWGFSLHLRHLRSFSTALGSSHAAT